MTTPETTTHRDPLSGEFLETYKGNAQENLGADAVKFEPYRGLFFRAEFAIREDDMVFHFHKSEEGDLPALFNALGVLVNTHGPQTPAKVLAFYWEDTFARALDATAQSFFKADASRLMAQHVADPDKITEFMGQPLPLDSWWLKAKGYVLDTSDPHAMALGFYKVLEACLRRRNRT